ALDCFCQAAALIEKLDPEQRENEAMIYLMNNLADIVRTTGHYEEAIALWSRCLHQATQERHAEAFLEALMQIGQCFQSMGRIGEARERLELAVVLAGFLFEDEARLSEARALLADVLVTMGSIDDAKDNARASLRIAHKVRAARPTILSALALAETNLAAGQWKDALDDAQEALDEARRTNRTREVARARELRARAYLRQNEERLRANDDLQARDALNHAFAEALSSLDLASKAESVQDMLAARITLAHCYYRQGDGASAEREAQAAVEMAQSGAVGLTRLMGARAEALPEILRSGELNLPVIFSGRKLEMPVLEWQAHYLKGVLLAKRLGPEAGYAAMRDAARLVSRMLSTLNQSEAVAFQQRHPEVTAVFEDLTRFALTDKAQQETAALLEGTRWIPKTSPMPALIE
ncbi:MAG TPA: hypothetical protein VKU00_27690, partial [Chthonomonadaceae bacterium]|nr:hypothetical protein [Chthonomonadaceae bacterium]